MGARARVWLVAVLAGLLAVAGCTGGGPTGGGLGPRPGVPQAEAETLAKALTAGKLTGLDLVDPAAAQSDLDASLSGMQVLPRVTVGTITVSTEPSQYVATAGLRYSWPLAGGAWTYDSQALLQHSSDRWQVRWAPTIVHPDLTSTTRLRLERTQAPRASVTGAGGLLLAGNQEGREIGIDKTLIPAAAWPASARLLARVVNIDPVAYERKVLASGPRAFVIAQTVGGIRVPPAVYDVPGARALEAQVYMGATSGFAQPLLGIVGEATKPVIDKSNGDIRAGDKVGLSGLQLLYDKALRGVAGVKVTIVDRPARVVTTTARPPTSASPGSAAPTATASASARQSPTTDPIVLLERAPVQSPALSLTLNSAKQALAERVLAGNKESAIVAVKPSTGEIVAAASSPDARTSIATQGRYAPGSTFKVVSALALLRSGLTANSTVSCPASVVVDGRQLKNYGDYPSNRLGNISLRTAFAESCNTAFAGNQGRLSPSALADAGGSLGVGLDYEPGYYSFWGSVPQMGEPVARAEAMIGQGQVLASPLAMAAVAASVAAGKTVIPTLIPGKKIDSKGTPLTVAEAGQLQVLMRAVVSDGSGVSLKGIVTGAKSGTAEYGAKAPLRTRAWMIAYHGDLAVAVFVADGPSGTRTAGPLLAAFMRG